MKKRQLDVVAASACERRVSRRSILAGVLAGACSLAVSPAQAASDRLLGRSITLINLHTGERYTGPYRDAAGYIPGAIEELSTVLRDHRSNISSRMDPALFDTLMTVSGKLDVRPCFNVISGYRSPQTNAVLAARSGGVARDSLHTRGMAIDVAIEGIDLVRLRDASKAAAAGGVGFYPRSGFVHIDTGRVRFW